MDRLELFTKTDLPGSHEEGLTRLVAEYLDAHEQPLRIYDKLGLSFDLLGTVSRVRIALQPKYGAFPLPETTLRHRQLALPLKAQRRSFYQREMKRLSAVKKLFERVEGATS